MSNIINDKGMRKVMIALVCASVFSGASAQTNETPTEKYSVATNKFWNNWFVSGGVNFSSFYSNQELKAMSNAPFIDARRALGFDVAVGKWFTPGLGLRTKVTAMWGKAPYTDGQVNKFKYWDAQEQILFNLSNLLYGYSDTRVWNLIPYVGAGIDRNCSSGDNFFASSFGILNTWKVCKRVNVNLDLSMTVAEGEFDGSTAGVNNNGNAYFKPYDRQFTASVGITYNIGKTGFKKVPDVEAIIAANKSETDALQASLADAQSENARLKDLLAKASQPKTEMAAKTELASTGVSVFFNLNSSKVASKKDLVNVKEIAKYVQTNGGKISVVGYADSKTGSADYNKKLSERRAQTVADELVKMGVNRDNIEMSADGGVNTLSPISYNRRAIVTLK